MLVRGWLQPSHLPKGTQSCLFKNTDMAKETHTWPSQASWETLWSRVQEVWGRAYCQSRACVCFFLGDELVMQARESQLLPFRLRSKHLHCLRPLPTSSFVWRPSRCPCVLSHSPQPPMISSWHCIVFEFYSTRSRLVAFIFSAPLGLEEFLNKVLSQCQHFQKIQVHFASISS